MEKRPLKRTLIFIPFIFLYLVCVDRGIIIIDPCAATPGHDYITGLILLASFPFVAGVLFHWYLGCFNFPKRKRYWIAGLFPSTLLAISSFLMRALFFNVEEDLSNGKVWFFLYNLECYNDAVPKPLVLFLAISVMFYLLLLMVFILFRTCIRRRNRYN